VFLNHFLELVPYQLPSDVLLPGVVGGDSLVGVAGAHEISRDLTDGLVRGGVAPDKIELEGLDVDRFLQWAELGDNGGDFA
jgi:hypothetical protein